MPDIGIAAPGIGFLARTISFHDLGNLRVQFNSTITTLTTNLLEATDGHDALVIIVEYIGFHTMLFT